MTTTTTSASGRPVAIVPIAKAGFLKDAVSPRTSTVVLHAGLGVSFFFFFLARKKGVVERVGSVADDSPESLPPKHASTHNMRCCCCFFSLMSLFSLPPQI